jgi:GR25 family glycosyltransferase involved in LPS biosynthesis
LPTRSDRRDGTVLAAALSNIDIEFIDGVYGDKVPDKAIPNTDGQSRLPDPSIGSWRGHMNAIQEVVRRNLSSALILEDDADWDIFIRAQLQSFALSSQALAQPISGTKSVYADPTYPNPDKAPSSRPPDLSFDHLPHIEAPVNSPYGDHWDALWLGHCGMHFPFENDNVIPKGRVVQSDPHTIPQQQHLWTLSEPNDLKEQYPNYTRVVHHVQDGICSLGYAVSRKGARQMLYELGLKNFNAAFDILLRWYCEGASDRGYHNCLTVQPALFQHHRFAGLKGANSDISEHDKGFQNASTDVVRWSVRMNAAAIMDGKPLVDQHPDAEQ